MKKNNLASKNDESGNFLGNLIGRIMEVESFLGELKKLLFDKEYNSFEIALLALIKRTDSIIAYIEDESKEIIKQKKSANKIEGDKIKIAAIIHDVNNILGTVKGRSELALVIYKDGMYLEIEEELNYALSAVKMATLTINKKRTSVKKQDLVESLKMALTLIPAHNNSDIQVITDFPDDQINVRGDSADLVGVFLNLYFNAIYAVKEKRSYFPDQDRALGVFVNLHDKVVAVDFVDNGIGMSLEQCNSIFNPTFTTKGENGKGMGLYSCREIIKNKLGGDISVDSSLGAGTTFSLKIPIIDGHG